MGANNSSGAKHKPVWLMDKKAPEDFSKTQYKAYQYFLDNYQHLPMMHVSEIAEDAGVSPATVVRLVYTLGYDSYKELREELRDYLQRTAPLWPKLEGSINRRSDSELSLQRITEENIKVLTSLNSPEVMAQYEAVFQRLKNAGKIYIVGARSSKSAAYYLYYMLHQIMSNVVFINQGVDELYENLIDITKNDAVIAISYGAPHYATSTINIIRVLYGRGIGTILLTDERTNPAVRFASQVLCIPMESSHYTLIAIINVIDALTVDLGKVNSGERTNRLYRLLKLLKDEAQITDLPE